MRIEKELQTQITSYKDLKVWQAAIELAVECYGMTRNFPASETYGMTSQIRRCSASIAANIAEGHGRENRGSFIQFLRIAQGSLKELETHIAICRRVSLLDEAVSGRVLDQCDKIGRMLRALIRRLQETK